ncbi:hypothetical protein M0R72_19975 [Candidatus Pacearchaeota archaeon]|nr:hypothetical protein [Candidatus Pacearchaeota archaeon]
MTDRQIAAVSCSSSVTDTFLMRLRRFVPNPSMEEMCFAATLSDSGFLDFGIIDMMKSYRRLLEFAKGRDNEEWYAEYKRLE